MAVIYTTFAVAKRKSEKNSRLFGIRTVDLCYTGAALYQRILIVFRGRRNQSLRNDEVSTFAKNYVTSDCSQFVRVFPQQRSSYNFFNRTVVCCRKPSYFFLSFIFWQSFKYFLYFFHLCICVSVNRKFCFSFLFITRPFLWIIIVCFLYLILR